MRIIIVCYFILLTESKCDPTSLSNTINGISVSINQTVSDINVIDDAKKNVRIAIDCRANTGVRSQLFDHYEALDKRNVILKNVLSDLKIKMYVLEKEKQRCQDRSKYNLPVIKKHKSCRLLCRVS